VSRRRGRHNGLKEVTYTCISCGFEISSPDMGDFRHTICPRVHTLATFAKKKEIEMKLKSEVPVLKVVPPVKEQEVTFHLEQALTGIYLNAKTPTETWALARLEVKNGQVVMYRVRGIEDPLINTDKEGRIQN